MKTWLVGLCAFALTVMAPTLANADQVSGAHVDTGTAGSLCQPTTRGQRLTPPPPGIHANPLGTRLPYQEAAFPGGRHTGRRAVGVMMVINGGGWYVAGAGLAPEFRSAIDYWRSRGWIALFVAYRGCKRSVNDVLHFYDAIRRRWPGLPICADGASAGGHLALMLAALRPKLACAISEAGPTDLRALRHEFAYAPPQWGLPAGPQQAGPEWVYQLAVAAFGVGHLAENSPMTYVSRIRARLLLLIAANDPFVPLTQQTSFVARLRAFHPNQRVMSLILPPGPDQWVHGSTSPAGLQAARRAEDALLGPLYKAARRRAAREAAARRDRNRPARVASKASVLRSGE